LDGFVRQRKEGRKKKNKVAPIGNVGKRNKKGTGKIGLKLGKGRG